MFNSKGINPNKTSGKADRGSVPSQPPSAAHPLFSPAPSQGGKEGGSRDERLLMKTLAH